MQASHVVNVVVKVIINIVFVVAALQIVNIKVLTDVGTAIIGYMPAVLSALVVLIVAWIAGEAAQRRS